MLSELSDLPYTDPDYALVEAMSPKCSHLYNIFIIFAIDTCIFTYLIFFL